jgi:hypothetical protein
MQLHCPACLSNDTYDFFAFTAAGMPPQCLEGGVLDNIPADRNISQLLFGPEFDRPMVVRRFSFPPRPHLTSFSSIACFIFPVFSVIVAIRLLFEGDSSFIPIAMITPIAGAIIGSIPILRRKAWDLKWAARYQYLTRIASCRHCFHAWRP